MPAAMAMGQAAGLAANMAIRSGCLPFEISVPDLQDGLRRLGALIDG
jgi:hypothetical protein